MNIVYLGIGSNMGNREKNIHDALSLLEKNNIEILKKSSLIETNPVGGPQQADFLNGALKVKTDHSPEELLVIIKAIETQLGRVKTILNGPRPIDIDILLYNNIAIDTPALTIPHPRMKEREFVLQPLKEIEPNLKL